MRRHLLPALLLLLPSAVSATGFEDPARIEAVARAHLEAASRQLPGRVTVELAAPDPQLRLPACADLRAELVEGSRAWGAGQVRVRCAAEPAWSVTLRSRVRALVPAMATRSALPAGYVLAESDLQTVETDLASTSRPPLTDARLVIGRALRSGALPGQPLLDGQLRALPAVHFGAAVELTASVGGISVRGAGVAMADAPIGETVRVKAGSGRILTGTVVGEGRVEVPL